MFDRLQRKKLKELPPVDDRYLEWLGFANAGMLQPGNIRLIDAAVRELPPDAPVVEIGSFCGLSTNIISYLLAKRGRSNRLFSCDRWDFEGATAGGDIGNGISHQAYRDFVRTSFVRNVEFFSPRARPFTIELFSDEFFAAWRSATKTNDVFGREVTLGGPVSFCYVDGNHTYEFAKRDFQNTDECLVPGGFILFDDSFDGNSFGLTPLMREIEVGGRYELVGKAPNYLFRKR
jgi:hypothetical protein